MDVEIAMAEGESSGGRKSEQGDAPNVRVMRDI
jgi:hypothetical protein